MVLLLVVRPDVDCLLETGSADTRGVLCSTTPSISTPTRDGGPFNPPHLLPVLVVRDPSGCTVESVPTAFMPGAGGGVWARRAQHPRGETVYTTHGCVPLRRFYDCVAQVPAKGPNVQPDTPNGHRSQRGNQPPPARCHLDRRQSRNVSEKLGGIGSRRTHPLGGARGWSGATTCGDLSPASERREAEGQPVRPFFLFFFFVLDEKGSYYYGGQGGGWWSENGKAGHGRGARRDVTRGAGKPEERRAREAKVVALPASCARVRSRI